MFRFKTLLLAIVIVGGLVGFGLYMKQDKGPDPAIASTLSKYRGVDGFLHDPTNELGVKEAKDVAFMQKGDKIELYYGNVQFEIDPAKDLERLRQSLLVFGVEMGYNAQGKFLVKYKGQVVKELAQ